MRRCYFCNVTKTHESGLSFHKFPLNDQHLLKQWLNNFPIKNWTPANSTILCSNHFTEDCFDRTGFKVRLKPNSIPTRFDNPHSYCVYCKRKRVYKSGHSFFKFPLDKSGILKKWLDNMGIKNWTPNDNSLLCSEHFEQTCFHKITGKYLKLKDGSIPTIFKIECLNSIKSAVWTENISLCETEFSQKIQFNDKFDPQQASCNELRNEIQTHSAGENVDRLSISDNIGIINSINHDHHYDTSPSTLRKELIKNREILRNKEHIIKLQRQQLRYLQTRITDLKKAMTELRRQRMI